MITVSTTSNTNIYGWRVRQSSGEYLNNFTSTTDTNKWELLVSSGYQDISDRTRSYRSKQVAWLFRSATPATRRMLGLVGVRAGQARFTDPAKFPFVEAVLFHATTLFSNTTRGWGRYLTPQEWLSVIVAAQNSGPAPNIFLFTPAKGAKRAKSAPRIPPPFETNIATAYGSVTEFRWIPFSSRRRMAEAWISIEQHIQPNDEYAFVKVGFDCDDDLGIRRHWTYKDFFTHDSSRRSCAQRLGLSASTLTTTTFESENVDLPRLVNTLRAFAMHAMETGAMAEGVKRPLDEFLALAEGDELADAMMAMEPPSQKVRRRGVL